MDNVVNIDGTVNAVDVLAEAIGREEIKKATQTLHKYKSGKAHLEQRLVENEQWWKLRHWNYINDHSAPEDIKPVSAWLFNCIISKHADGMDAYPTFNCLPREMGDVEEAKKLSDILPVVLEQNDFEETYSDVLWQKLKGGTGCYGVFWDSNKLNGMGDISIRKIDILTLFWQPGIDDIQKSRNVFHTELVDNDLLEQRYPQLKDKLATSTIQTSKYVYDDSVDVSDKSCVVDWYYKKEINGKMTLQYCKYVNDEVLFSSENNNAEIGWYNHGLYPFVFDSLFAVEGTPCGFGYVDVCKEAQRYIDVMNQSIIENTLANASPRYFIREDGSVNEEEFFDLTKKLVHTHGNLGEDDLRQIQGNGLSDIYVSVLNNKIEELKETSGNRDVNNGGSASGVTAASAIAAMQEQSGKTSRDSTQASYRAYKHVINICIELIRQFYDIPRQFRIVGQMGREQFVSYDNSGILPQSQGNDFGIDMGMRTPVFDLKVSAQKNTPYSKLSQNEMALQFFQLGFFNPQMSDQALACLDMMDFDGKDDIMQKISMNGTLAKQLAMYQQMALTLASEHEPEIAEGLASQITGQPMPNGTNQIKPTETNSDGSIKEKNTIVEKAKANANASTQPR